MKSNRKVIVLTTYTDVNNEFIEEVLLPKIGTAFRKDFYAGEPIVYASKDPESEMSAHTTYQLIEHGEVEQ